MTVLVNIILPVLLVVATAALAQTRLHLDIRTLSRAAFYLFAPALVFDSLASSDVSGTEFGQMTAVLALTTLVLWILGALVARLLHLEGATRPAFLIAILIMNAGNYGLPVNLFAFGETGLARASVYFVGSALFSASLGVYLSARGRATAKFALGRMASMPLLHAALLGLVFSLGNLTIPGTLAKAIHLLGQAAVPSMLLVLGVRLTETFQNRQRTVRMPALGAVTVLRLIVAPVLAWLFANMVGLNGLARDVSVLQSAMPTAVMTTILATEFDSDASFAALCVVVTTLVSLPVLTILLNLLP